MIKILFSVGLNSVLLGDVISSTVYLSCRLHLNIAVNKFHLCAHIFFVTVHVFFFFVRAYLLSSRDKIAYFSNDNV